MSADETRPMTGLEIHLKSGGVVVVEATDVTTTRDRLTGALTAIEWNKPPRARRVLHTVNPEDVAAVVAIR